MARVAWNNWQDFERENLPWLYRCQGPIGQCQKIISVSKCVKLFQVCSVLDLGRMCMMCFQVFIRSIIRDNSSSFSIHMGHLFHWMNSNENTALQATFIFLVTKSLPVKHCFLCKLFVLNKFRTSVSASAWLLLHLTDVSNVAWLQQLLLFTFCCVLPNTYHYHIETTISFNRITIIIKYFQIFLGFQESFPPQEMMKDDL